MTRSRAKMKKHPINIPPHIHEGIIGLNIKIKWKACDVIRM